MSFQEYNITDIKGDYSRKIWFKAGPENVEHRLCIILDAEFYIEHIEVMPILEKLSDDPGFPEQSWLLVSHVDAQTRHEDFVCNKAYADFIANDVVTWARNTCPSIQPSENLIGGVSLSGLMSAFITLQHPETFSLSLCQSGSFWWEHEWFLGLIQQHAPIKTKFWLSVGDKETDEHVEHTPALYQVLSQITGVVGVAKSLEEHRGTVHYNLYEGGHEAEPWKNELVEALQWLLQT